jgi:hypothetical protein
MDALSSRFRVSLTSLCIGPERLLLALGFSHTRAASAIVLTTPEFSQRACCATTNTGEGKRLLGDGVLN